MAITPCLCDPQTDNCVKLVARGNCLDVDFIIAGNPAEQAWPYACAPGSGNGLHCSPDGAWVDPSACVKSINIPNLYVPMKAAPWDTTVSRIATASPVVVTNPSSCYDMTFHISMSMLSSFESTGPYRAIMLWGFAYKINGGAEVLVQSSRYSRSISFPPLTATVSIESCDSNCPDPAPRPVTFDPWAPTIRDQVHDAFGWSFTAPPSASVELYQIYDFGWVDGGVVGNTMTEGSVALRGIALSMKSC